MARWPLKAEHKEKENKRKTSQKSKSSVYEYQLTKLHFEITIWRDTSETYGNEEYF